MTYFLLKEVKVSMHVCMHVGICVPMPNTTHMNDGFVFFFIPSLKGREG